MSPWRKPWENSPPNILPTLARLREGGDSDLSGWVRVLKAATACIIRFSEDAPKTLASGHGAPLHRGNACSKRFWLPIVVRLRCA